MQRNSGLQVVSARHPSFHKSKDTHPCEHHDLKPPSPLPASTMTYPHEKKQSSSSLLLEDARNMLFQLWGAIDTDLQGRYSKPFDDMAFLEDNFGRLMALMSAAPSETKAWTEGICITAEQREQRKVQEKEKEKTQGESAAPDSKQNPKTRQQSVVMAQKQNILQNSCMQSNLDGERNTTFLSKCTQTTSTSKSSWTLDQYVRRIQQCVRTFLYHKLYPGGIHQRHRSFEIQRRLVLKRSFGYWSDICIRRRRRHHKWHERVLLRRQHSSMSRELLEPTWIEQVKASEGLYGVAKAYFTRKTVRARLDQWIRFMVVRKRQAQMSPISF